MVEKEITESVEQELIYPAVKRASFGRQLSQIIGRGLIEIKRNPVVVTAWIVLNALLSLILAAMFWRIPDDRDDPFNSINSQNRGAFLYMAALVNFMYGCYPLTLTFPIVSLENLFFFFLRELFFLPQRF